MKNFITIIFLSLIMFILTIFFISLEDEAVTIAVTDIEGLEHLEREFGPFKDKLEELSGYKFKFFPVLNRTLAVEAMKSNKVDFVLTGPAEYVLLKKKNGCKPVVGFSRHNYYASIIVLSDSGIDHIKDLKNKKIALGEAGSTSKHLAPIQIIKENGLDPLYDLELIHTGNKLGWESLKKGDVDALGITNDKFLAMSLLEKEHESGSFKVIARGRELPNDILLAGKHIDDNIIKNLVKTFKEHSEELIKEILKGENNQKYKSMKFLTDIKDSDYNYVREMYKTAGYPQFSDFSVKKFNLNKNLTKLLYEYNDL